VRVIKPSRVREFAKSYPDAEKLLLAWLKIVQRENWESIAQLRAIFPKADGVKAASGKIVTVFNIGGNKYRLITAIHFNRSRIFVLRFLTHSEYDKEKWKADL
jgi:mRNA interferase HigB